MPWSDFIITFTGMSLSDCIIVFMAIATGALAVAQFLVVRRMRNEAKQADTRHADTMSQMKQDRDEMFRFRKDSIRRRLVLVGTGSQWVRLLSSSVKGVAALPEKTKQYLGYTNGEGNPRKIWYPVKPWAAVRNVGAGSAINAWILFCTTRWGDPQNPQIVPDKSNPEVNFRLALNWCPLMPSSYMPSEDGQIRFMPLPILESQEIEGCLVETIACLVCKDGYDFDRRVLQRVSFFVEKRDQHMDRLRVRVVVGEVVDAKELQKARHWSQTDIEQYLRRPEPL